MTQTIVTCNRGTWLGNLAKFFVCLFILGLTLHKTWQNTKGVYFSHPVFSKRKLIENMLCISIKLLRDSWKSGRTQKSCGNSCLSAHVPTTFLILLNFHSCFNNLIGTRNIFSISPLYITKTFDILVCRDNIFGAMETSKCAVIISVGCGHL